MNGESRRRSIQELREWFDSLEGDEKRKFRLRAFGDFCLDLLEEKDGRRHPQEEIDQGFVKGLLSHF
jgi:hypothetical protein